MRKKAHNRACSEVYLVQAINNEEHVESKGRTLAIMVIERFVREGHQTSGRIECDSVEKSCGELTVLTLTLRRCRTWL